jgi:ATP dependent DNA ligase domain
MLRTRLVPAGFVAPCLPSPADRPPSGPGWVHEIKHDGFRMLVLRGSTGVRLLTRNGHDWSERYPQIWQAAEALKARSFLIDGEAVACDQDGMPSFDRLRYRRQDSNAVLQPGVVVIAPTRGREDWGEGAGSVKTPRSPCGLIALPHETNGEINRPWGLEDRDRPSGPQGLEDRLRQLVLAIRQGRVRQLDPAGRRVLAGLVRPENLLDQRVRRVQRVP